MKNPRILAIDDEPDNLLLLRQALRHLGYPQCEMYTDPAQAVARFQAETFDLVLLDYNMPGLSGMDVLAALSEKSRQEQIPVIMVTAQGDRDTRVMTLNAGAKDFLTKPIDMAELAVRVDNLIETRHLHCQLRLQNEQLEATVAQRTEELRTTQLEVIRRLARAAEFRDNDTGVHVQRMSLYAETMGEALGLSSQARELLLNACPMHDIGKIGISDQILLKPGKLTADEFAIMQQHSLIGASILTGHPSALLSAAHDIALHHHEKWNGKGYPHGLSGEAIPLFARIAAVADVFDALTMERPYKPAWDAKEARDEITRQSGQHFDPAVVTAFKIRFNDLLAIRMAHPDLQAPS